MTAPKTTPISLHARANWVRKLYPDVDILEAHDGPTVVGESPRIKEMHEEYILNALHGRQIAKFYSSEFYGEHVSQALGAIDRRIDPDRIEVPVSGTTIRENPFAHRQFIDPIVYWDLVQKVVFLGAPSTGKTTIARAMAKKLNTAWMPEYGREYWEKHQESRRLTINQLVEIAKGHRQREERLIHDADRSFFVDTDATTTMMFSLYYHGRADPELVEWAAQTRDRYDLFLLMFGRHSL